mmetsp:Transcript_27986/g.61410  ORF Transcript_27986/g.61410 Transcript_27986/m.61410 type:complete len:560 (+) Transcript_27986:130-1809(+)|eukprot:CAMPEP_0202891168 /NCGR_PEP_ID=MMETSP1392-20130828/1305_1 /ASSEMBLY_ACC=CAM_ASM_000868 /TAXON_ID=225041 /ORGANISM="Chlamydomonas chlamydogama, Strain SAG 11-48b" /LENGTH=559 /DNA_ID=CAMNT_0049574851 /DNA_START=130 /DNA_END=1809 /DNA_ORIENTATION=+
MSAKAPSVTRLPLLSRLWGDRETSDIRLDIFTTIAEGEQIVRACDAHSAVLMGGSEFFWAQLKGWRVRDAGPQDRLSKRARLSAPVGEGEEMEDIDPSEEQQHEGSQPSARIECGVPAGTADDTRMVAKMILEPGLTSDIAVEVVRFLYYGKLSDEAARDPAMLIQVIHVADAFLMEPCVSACEEALGALPPSTLLHSCCMSQIRQLPSNCAHRPGLQSVFEKTVVKLFKDVHRSSPTVEGAAGDTMRAAFMDLMSRVEHILSSTHLSAALMQLPHAWIHFWAGSDALFTHDENDVALLLLMWLEGEQGRTCTQEQRDELLSQIRVRQLSPSYKHGVMPRALASSPGLLQQYVLLRAVQDAPQCDFLLNSFAACRAPPAWTLEQQRNIPTLPGWPWTLDRSITRGWMQTMLDSVLQAPVRSEPRETLVTGMLRMGYLVMVSLEMARQGDGPRPRVSVGVACYLVPYVPLPLTSNTIRELFQRRTKMGNTWPGLADFTLSFIRADGSEHVFSHSGVVPSRGVHCVDFLTTPHARAASVDDLQQFIVDGKFRLKCIVRDMQ